MAKNLVKTQPTDPLIQVIDNVYPVVLAMSICILFLDAISYENFIANRTQISTNLIIWLSFFGSFFHGRGSEKRTVRLTYFLLSLLCTSMIITIGLLYLESTRYLNFVYSTLHINLSTLPSLVSFLLINFIGFWYFGVEQMRKVAKSLFLFLSKSQYYTIHLIVIVLISSLAVKQVGQTYYTIGNNLRSLILVSRLSRHDRITQAYGGKDGLGWINVLGDFVSRNTPENAIVYIPPQTESWQMEGNEAFFRYFIYPRKIVQTNNIVDSIPERATHILIAHGTFLSNSETQRVWPRITIEASMIENIIYIDRGTLNETLVTNASYEPSFDREAWGIIQLK